MIWYYQSKSSQYVGFAICLLNSSILWHTCSCYWRYDLTRCLQPVYGRLWGTPATSVKRFVELQITTTFRQYQRDAAIKQWSRVKFDWTSRYHLLCSSLRFISLLYVRPTVSKPMSLNRYYTLVDFCSESFGVLLITVKWLHRSKHVLSLLYSLLYILEKSLTTVTLLN